MPTTRLNPSSAKPFRILAWYGLIAPLVAAGLIGLIALSGVPDRPAGSPAETAFNLAACVLISSACASILSLFGGPIIGWRVVLGNAARGLLLSCVTYLALIWIGFGMLRQ